MVTAIHYTAAKYPQVWIWVERIAFKIKLTFFSMSSVYLKFTKIIPEKQ